MKTYRQRLQAMTEVVDRCYDEIGILRDYSDSKETEYCNLLRGKLQEVYNVLRNMDDQLPDWEAKQMTKGIGFCEKEKV